MKWNRLASAIETAAVVVSRACLGVCVLFAIGLTCVLCSPLGLCHVGSGLWRYGKGLNRNG